MIPAFLPPRGCQFLSILVFVRAADAETVQNLTETDGEKTSENILNIFIKGIDFTNFI